MTTLKDGSPANVSDILVDAVLRAGSQDKTVRRGGRAQAVRCILSCVSSTEIQARARERELSSVLDILTLPWVAVGCSIGGSGGAVCWFSCCCCCPCCRGGHRTTLQRLLNRCVFYSGIGWY